jgi:hypothetical protein
MLDTFVLVAARKANDNGARKSSTSPERGEKLCFGSGGIHKSHLELFFCTKADACRELLLSQPERKTFRLSCCLLFPLFFCLLELHLEENFYLNCNAHGSLRMNTRSVLLLVYMSILCLLHLFFAFTSQSALDSSLIHSLFTLCCFSNFSSR